MAKPAARQPSLADQACEPCRSDSPALDTTAQHTLLAYLPGWQILPGALPKLQRRYRFDNFRDALAFTNAIGELAEAENHHPSLLTEWGSVTVTWWTHAIAGLHRNDFILAARTDAIATQANLP
ncbi:4a-hydroxytetrahydrobiopterin dehydratase [Pseudomonas sp. Marseille-QA0892]